MTPDTPIRLFYSYSHKDESFREELETHLAILRRKGIIQEWHDRKLDPGDEWRKEIEEQMEAADVILLLISPDFVASDFCYEQELASALERHGRGEAVVVPIILRPVDFEASPFARLLALPTDARAVTVWENRDEAWLSVARGIRKVCASADQIFGAVAKQGEEIEVAPDDLDDEDLGVLDFNAIMEELFEDIAATQEHVGKRTAEINAEFTSQTGELQGLHDYGGPDKARKARDIARKMGGHLSSFAKEMIGLGTDMEESWADVDRLFPRMIRTSLEDGALSDDSAADLKELHQTLGVVAPQIEAAKESAAKVATNIADLGKHSIHLKLGARPAAKSLERFRDIYWGIENSLGQMQRNIEELLSEHGHSLNGVGASSIKAL
jgi:hypothetical protein